MFIVWRSFGFSVLSFLKEEDLPPRYFALIFSYVFGAYPAIAFGNAWVWVKWKFQLTLEARSAFWTLLVQLTIQKMI